MSAVPQERLMSIGEVLARLRPDFPDVTISKLRFLEDKGLVEPRRTPSGYRKFSHQDVSRLHYVLAAQRDLYLPLKVIREHLDAMDRGLVPSSAPDGASRPPAAPTLVATDGLPDAGDFSRPTPDVRLTRQELLVSSGLNEAALADLESYGLVSRQGNHYDTAALRIATTVAELAEFGLSARHLRPFKVAADREVGLVEQVINPMLRAREPQAREHAQQAARRLAALSVRLHTDLVRSGLDEDLLR